MGYYAESLVCDLLRLFLRSPLPVGWDKLVHARTKMKKSLRFYGNVGYESIFSEFGKKYPDMKLSYVAGRGSADIVPRVLSEQRAEKYLGDIFLAGPNGTFIIHQAKGLDALKPAFNVARGR